MIKGNFRVALFAAVAAMLCSPVRSSADIVTAPPAPFARPGDIFSNEEQVYFAQEAGQPAPPLIIWRFDADMRMIAIDAFGQPTGANNDGATANSDGNIIAAKHVDGTAVTLRRARTATCWAAIPKDKPKADGKPDWYFARDITLHDQGGRARVGGGNSGAPEYVIRMRNVIWPDKADGTPSTNRPSLVLYVHKPDQPDSAESYVWADPGAARIGINLRAMQASCTIDGKEPGPVPNGTGQSGLAKGR